MLKEACLAAREGKPVVVFGHSHSFARYLRDAATNIDPEASVQIRFEVWQPEISLVGRRHAVTFVDHFAAGVP